MAAYFFAKGLEAFHNKVMDWEVDDFRAILIDTGAYTVNLETHDFLADVAAGARIAVSGALQNKSLTVTSDSGRALLAFDSDDMTIAAVPGPTTVEAIMIYWHTGSDATARPFIWISSGTGLPLTPTGNDVTITWPSGTTKIIAIKNPA